MGNFLDKPVTDKVSEKGFGSDISYGVCSMQGWRDAMEDQHSINVGLPSGLENWSLFALFDGHGGGEVSLYCSEHILNALTHTMEFEHYLQKKDDSNETDLMIGSLNNAFLTVEENMRICPEIFESRAGSTVICVLISALNFYIANCGDSRAVLWRDSCSFFSTEDHKPTNPAELRRIQRAGGIVQNERVNGSLAVSRSLGDFRFKQSMSKSAFEQLVSPEPEITVIPRNNELDEFIVIACDGIWDVMENNSLCKYIRHMLQITTDIELICSSVIDACLHKGSKDNMSIIVVVLPGAPVISDIVVRTEQKLDQILERKLTDIVSHTEDINLSMTDIVAILSQDQEVVSNYELWFKCSYLQTLWDRLK